MSLGALSGRSGVSKGTLSKVEAGSANPTLETLETLASALGVALADLVSPQSTTGMEVVRAGGGVELSDRTLPGRLVKALTTPRMVVEVHDLRVPPGAYQTSATHGEGAWEHVLVQAGPVEVGPTGETVVLHADDYAVYPADTPHVWHAPGSTEARVWVVLTTGRSTA
jgi:DNA-binding XRE family transcriptional regulator